MPTQSPQETSVTQETLNEQGLVRSAEATYRRYLNDLEVVSEAGNEGYSRLRSYLSTAAYEEESKSFEQLSARGLHTTGATKLIKFQQQSANLRDGKLTAYACIDLSDVRLVNEAGKDVTPKSRPGRQTFLPSFAVRNRRVILMENGTWAGDSIC
ncbi:hypothetical protein D1781_15350 [Amnibacterium setariae]|uniref:Uncharacterized protein n=1 Tax=Amnibacterium setariae TaxID=2306585 RepID=A0A3A1U774_9MICO|nr:hypothetical protein D1781_15350 [Amnibacterium setariae]